MKEIFTITAIRKHLLFPLVIPWSCPQIRLQWLSPPLLQQTGCRSTLCQGFIKDILYTPAMAGFGIGCGMRKDILTALSLFFHVKRQIVIISTYSVLSSSPYFFGKQWIVCRKRPKHGLLKVFSSFLFPTSSHCTPNYSFVLFSL